jgi:transposase-like protein
MARYSPAFKNRAVSRLLPPEASSPEVVAREFGIGVNTLLRWQENTLSTPARSFALTSTVRFDAVIATAGMDESSKNAWCREHGVYPGELAQWCAHAHAALADIEPVRANTQQTRQDKKRIKELERDLTRKNAALAETAALLVLAKKLSVIFQEGADA